MVCQVLMEAVQRREQGQQVVHLILSRTATGSSARWEKGEGQGGEQVGRLSSDVGRPRRVGQAAAGLARCRAGCRGTGKAGGRGSRWCTPYRRAQQREAAHVTLVGTRL